jgi:WbqC-like protein family
MLRWFLTTLGIQVTFLRASELGLEGKKSSLVLDLCRKLGTTSYLSGCLGRNYLDEIAFQKAGIEVFYQDYHHPTYKQVYPGFEPYMAAIDLLFNCGPDSLGTIMQHQASLPKTARTDASRDNTL